MSNNIIWVGSAMPELTVFGGLGDWSMSDLSNFGPLVDLFAPGGNIISLSADESVRIEMSGTSVAAPHVTGAAALFLLSNPSATPHQVQEAIAEAAITDVTKKPVGTTSRRLTIRSF